MQVSHSGRVTPDNRAFGKYIGGWVDAVDHLDDVEKKNSLLLKRTETQIVGHPGRNLIATMTKTTRDYCTEYLKRFS
jgi:hypothetical protein